MPKLAPFNPTGDGAIQLALELLQPQASDILYDIGCGDARLLTEAVRRTNCQCVGIEYDEKLVGRARSNIQKNQMEERIQLIHEDAVLVDISHATLIFAYLVPTGIQLLKPKLEKARQSGVKIVTYMFSIPEWEPADTKIFKGTKVYLYS